MDEETLPEVAFLVETLEDKVRDKSREAPVRGTRGHRWGHGGTAACPAWGARFQCGRVSPSDLNACRKAAGRCGDAGRQAPGAGGTRHPWRVRQLRFICAHGRVLHGHGKGRRPGGTVRVTPGQRWLCQAPGGLGGRGCGDGHPGRFCLGHYIGGKCQVQAKLIRKDACYAGPQRRHVWTQEGWLKNRVMFL